MNGCEAYLLELAKYGEPRLSLLSKGWYCALDMHVSSIGCSFKVESEFGHASPSEAVIKCLERMREALKGFGELPKQQELPHG